MPEQEGAELPLPAPTMPDVLEPSRGMRALLFIDMVKSLKLRETVPILLGVKRK